MCKTLQDSTLKNFFIYNTITCSRYFFPINNQSGQSVYLRRHESSVPGFTDNHWFYFTSKVNKDVEIYSVHIPNYPHKFTSYYPDHMLSPYLNN